MAFLNLTRAPLILTALILRGAFAAFDAVAQQKPVSITDGCQQACADLDTIFGPASALHYPSNDPTFTIWDAKQAAVTPACRVEPSNVADVTQILAILTRHWCTFAVKGGGHSRAVDASNSVGGVTVDMGRLDVIEVAADRQSARLGAGLVLQEAYQGVEAEGVSFVGGRVASVGLAGYTMGGGFSNLTPKMGLAVDNVLGYELVLPNATVVNVTYESEPDLYFALRGGANNFGIVTHFTVRVVPQGKQLFAEKIFSSNYTDRVLAEAHRLTTSLANDTDMAYWTRYAYNQSSGTYVHSLSMAYLQPELEPAVFAGVNAIPFESSTQKVDWMSNIATDVPFGLRHLFTTLTYTPSAELDARIYSIFREEVAAVAAAEGFAPSVVIQPLHANAIRAARAHGGSAIGLESPDGGPLTIALLTFGWSSAANDAAMYAFAESFRARSETAAREMGLLNRFLYINYCKEDQDPFGGYGEENKQRLQSIQAKVDPEGIFTSSGLNRGYFKLR
ncbi:Fad binding domain-containing protein [Lasiodiplodia theobromae]|uniref:Fad binding domain-containing protein n=1 Tax=Lasiodiplodia theobromae TaxID=45133 RepID=UPI0015C2D024|nr:Fad binding domain-containing protein [Lasiodiplodia theobromae]KAF4541573.1 Fad binding domain-containing protein [Lasiodiplodia theobromae]